MERITEYYLLNRWCVWSKSEYIYVEVPDEVPPEWTDDE